MWSTTFFNRILKEKSIISLLDKTNNNKRFSSDEKNYKGFTIINCDITTEEIVSS